MPPQIVLEGRMEEAVKGTPGTAGCLTGHNDHSKGHSWSILGGRKIRESENLHESPICGTLLNKLLGPLWGCKTAICERGRARALMALGRIFWGHFHQPRRYFEASQSLALRKILSRRQFRGY
ncbi:hypothetical protein CDAR_454891 [Caerostris darwini]|uniref:Uncharacterized protein n=1 Tax=Caerostris darwini TaxID=1538125 RepID=A0AAV4WT65_9ARAC|nr:hypothetical protein CDAR_454891 [Caerostris darwini]